VEFKYFFYIFHTAAKVRERERRKEAAAENIHGPQRRIPQKPTLFVCETQNPKSLSFKLFFKVLFLVFSGCFILQKKSWKKSTQNTKGKRAA
jgi:hypothetical protein